MQEEPPAGGCRREGDSGNWRRTVPRLPCHWHCPWRKAGTRNDAALGAGI